MTERVHHLPPHLEGQSSWLSKATSASILGHPAVWTAMTAMFILGGYLWLQYYARPLSDRIGQANTESTLIGADSGGNWNPEIYRDIATEEKMHITRQADDLRADNYREVIDLENRIQPLLDQAREYLEKEAYTGLNHKHAWQAYQSVLGIDPDHKLAQSGQSQIIGLLQGNAEYAVEQQKYEEAERWLGELEAIEENSTFQQNLRQQIAEQIALEVAMFEEEKRIEQLIKLRDGALLDAEAAMQLSPPELRVAYDLYMRALELDEQSDAAQKGLKSIYQQRAELAEKALSDQRFTDAEQQIERLRETHADPALIMALQAELSAAQNEAQKNEVEVPEPVPPTPVPKPEPEVELKIQPQFDTTPIYRSTELPGVELTPPSFPGEMQQAIPQVNTAQPSVEEITTEEVQIKRAPVIAPVITDEVTVSRNAPTDSKRQQLSTGINAYYAGDYNTAFSKLHPLAEANSPRAQFRLGVMYYQGRTVVQNEDLARQWIARALPAVLRSAQQGQAWAEADLGTAYELGIGVKRDLKNAASWYQKAAQQGYVGGQTNLGVLYGTGVGVNYDRQAALYWLKKAADQGDKVAQDNLKILNAR